MRQCDIGIMLQSKAVCMAKPRPSAWCFLFFYAALCCSSSRFHFHGDAVEQPLFPQGVAWSP